MKPRLGKTESLPFLVGWKALYTQIDPKRVDWALCCNPTLGRGDRPSQAGCDRGENHDHV